MSHAEFTVTVVDLDPDTHGELAAKFIVDTENEKRASMDPPEELLPVSPWEALKASYLSVLSSTINSAHLNYIQQQSTKQAADDQLNERWMVGGESERTAALAALPPVGTPIEAVAHDGSEEDLSSPEHHNDGIISG